MNMRKKIKKHKHKWQIVSAMNLHLSLMPGTPPPMWAVCVKCLKKKEL